MKTSQFMYQGVRRRRQLFVLIAAVTFLAVASTGGAIAGSRTVKADWASDVTLGAAGAGATIASAGRGVEIDPAADILARIGSPRVLSIDLVGDTASIRGRASAPGAESARTLWYQTIAGAAYAQKVGATGVSRKAITETGALIEQSDDPVYTATSGRDWFAPVNYSAAEITQGVSDRAASVEARVLRTNYIALFGGIAEILVQPYNEAAFMAASGHRIAVILGELGTKRLPYLVTVVDSHGEPRLVVGWVPSVGGTSGWGVGWQAPGVQASAMWGS